MDLSYAPLPYKPQNISIFIKNCLNVEKFSLNSLIKVYKSRLIHGFMKGKVAHLKLRVYFSHCTLHFNLLMKRKRNWRSPRNSELTLKTTEARILRYAIIKAL